MYYIVMIVLILLAAYLNISPQISKEKWLPWIIALESFITIAFLCEILISIAMLRQRYFEESTNIFDFVLFICYIIVYIVFLINNETRDESKGPLELLAMRYAVFAVRLIFFIKRKYRHDSSESYDDIDLSTTYGRGNSLMMASV
mmetsp:Transcript_46773/g.53945  ORF Transcript_46773/g.53945 Transcript_46773/m.53945 type:complete len:145 (-) Transcript_46773:129-563(-)